MIKFSKECGLVMCVWLVGWVVGWSVWSISGLLADHSPDILADVDGDDVSRQ